MAEKGTCIWIELNKKQYTVIYHIVFPEIKTVDE
jgi:hypothetical protein